VLDFLIVAFVIFMLVKQINRLKKAAEVTTKECPKCISSISIRATRCPCCTSEL
jgi:large conductance mechanosensitive channel